MTEKAQEELAETCRAPCVAYAIEFTEADWSVIYDALGIAMVNTWPDDEVLIQADFENDDYERVHTKLADMAKRAGLQLTKEGA